jgi:GxxExxY protein
MVVVSLVVLGRPDGHLHRMSTRQRQSWWLYVEEGICRRCTQMNADEIRTNEVSERIIGCAFRVLNTLGTGFLEKVYENALAIEMREAGLSVARQKGITVYYKGVVVGEYVADLVVEQTVIVELKASKALDPVHTAQCINYLKATGLHLCLLLNFGRPRLEIRRVAHEL